MKIREIPEHVDFSSLVERYDFSKPAWDVLSTAVRKGDLNTFLQQEGNLDEYSREGMIGLLQLRLSNLRRQGRECHGFEEALAAVIALGDTQRICWMAIPTTEHLLIVLIEASSYEVLACMSLKRIVKDRLTPPPNWDGSDLV